MTDAHYHCPYDHEHPQPFAEGDKLYCGTCWVKNREITEMVLCNPETCPDEP